MAIRIRLAVGDRIVMTLPMLAILSAGIATSATRAWAYRNWMPKIYTSPTMKDMAAIDAKAI